MEVIIVEGMDGTGKTTLAHDLAKTFGLTYQKPMGPTTRELQRMYVYESLASMVEGDPVRVFDRFFFSELVYGPVLRGQMAFEPEEVAFVQRILQAAQCPIIVCEVDEATALANHQRTVEKDLGVAKYDHNTSVADQFNLLYEGYQEPKVRQYTHTIYSYEEPNDEYVYGLVGHYLEGRKARSG